VPHALLQVRVLRRPPQLISNLRHVRKHLRTGSSD
jgi:hypothetical protein